MHGYMSFINQLHSIHADVVTRRFGDAAIIRVDGVHARESDVPAIASGGAGLLRGETAVHGRGISIERPALENRKPSQIDLISFDESHHVLARAGSNGPRGNSKQRGEFPDLAPELAERTRWLRFRE